MNASTGSSFVALSVLIAICVSFSALTFAGRVGSGAARQHSLRGWLIAGGIAVGGGIWCLRVVADLALHMEVPAAADAVVGAFVLLTLVAAGSITTGMESLVRVELPLTPRRGQGVQRFAPPLWHTPIETRLASRRRRVARVLYVAEDVSDSSFALVRAAVDSRRPQDVEVLAGQPGMRAIESARHIRPDVVVLDLARPDAPAELLLRQLHRSPECSNVAIIVLSAGANSEQIDRLLAGGACAHVAKPLDVERFVAILDRVLAVRQAA